MDTKDCALITSAFEKGAHHTASEPAVFATLTRGTQATKTFAKGAQKTLRGYQRESTPSGNTGSSQTIAGIRAGSIFTVEKDQEDGDQRYLTIAKDCLPCIERILNNWSLRPLEELIDVFEFDLRNRLNWISHIEDLLGNLSLDTYADLCELLKFLNGMCVLDLQKILFLLSALNMDFALNFEGLLPMLRSLIAPLIAPPLGSLNGLLDQLMQLVLAPIDCIIESLGLAIKNLDAASATSQVLQNRFRALKNSEQRLNASRQRRAEESEIARRMREREEARSSLTLMAQSNNLSRLERDIALGTQRGAGRTQLAVGELGRTAGGPIQDFSAVVDPVTGRGLAQEAFELSGQQAQSRGQLAGGLAEMQISLIKARNSLEQKMLFYRDLLQQLAGSWRAMDDEYFQLSLNKLINIRLISLVVAIIRAKTEGKDLCDRGETPSEEALNTFFELFLNPNPGSPFEFAIDTAGGLVIRERSAPIEPPQTGVEVNVAASSRSNILRVQEDPLVNALVVPAQRRFPCRLKTSREDAAKINQWISDLNRLE